MKGKVCLITGSNSGIGKVTALELAKLGATVVMVSRDRKRGEEALEEIKQKSGNNDVHLMLADLASQKEIHHLAEEFKSKFDKLDVLINNAGLVIPERTVTVDGYEMTFAVNHLAYFLLTNLLLDTIKNSAPARIINVSSGLHNSATINFDDLQSEKKYSSIKAYGKSKLANILFTKELAKRLEGTGITVNCLRPGAVGTNIWGGSSKGIKGILVKIIKPFLLTPEQGAETTIYLATSPEVANITGKYFGKKKVVDSSKESCDPQIAAQLWKISEELTK